jgi:L-lysine epsilon oxidase C-terminal domain
LQMDGPQYAQGPGDITRWMALPWQGDTAFCRSGYDPEYDPYVPTFWAARVPNQVLTEEDYATVIDTSLPREARLAAYNHRAPWLRAIQNHKVADVMLRMIAEFGALGIVEPRRGVKGDPDFPETMFVESLAASHLRTVAMEVSRLLATPPRPLTRIERAGWSSDEQFREFRRVRVRQE